MGKMYATTIINTGGREGEVHSPEGDFSYKIVSPLKPEAGATNPEQLFAAGYSACFNGALSFVLQSEGIKEPATVSATVTLYNLGQSKLPNVKLGVEIEAHIEGLSLERAQELVEVAHTVCPYSKATAGNIDVTVKAV